MKFHKRKKIKTSLPPYEILKRRYRRFKIWMFSIIFLLVVGLGTLLYTHFNYILFRQLIVNHYVLTDDLDELFNEHLGFVPNNYGRYFDALVISIVTGEIRSLKNDVYTVLRTPVQEAVLQEWRQVRAEQAEFFEIAPNIGYLRTLNINNTVRDFILENQENMASLDNIIIDLRGNSGGWIPAMNRIASLFLPRNETIAHSRARWEIFSSHHRASGREYMGFDNIIIIQDGRTASAAEMLAAALRENLDNVIIIGEQSFGKGIGQIAIPLRGGFVVQATVINIETPSENTIHGLGIVPDIEYLGGDILDFAISLIGIGG